MEDPGDGIRNFAATVASSAPPLLWHYTTADGLLGILKDGALRATGLDYLNDASESTYMIQMVIEEVVAKVAKKDGLALRSLLSSLPLDLNRAVSCFCEHGDLLSQWRGYTSGKGFAIGFDSTKLAHYWIEDQREGLLAPARYSVQAAKGAASRYADEIAQAWAHMLPDGILAMAPHSTAGHVADEDVESLAALFPEFWTQIGYLFMSAAFHKNSAFSEEREWRLVTRLRRKGAARGEAFDFRASVAGITAYRLVAFQAAPKVTPISAIRIGPGLDFGTQKPAIELLLRELGFANVDVLPSEVPLRVV